MTRLTTNLSKTINSTNMQFMVFFISLVMLNFTILYAGLGSIKVKRSIDYRRRMVITGRILIAVQAVWFVFTLINSIHIFW